MISQTGEYALRAVVCLAAEPGGRLTTAQMADRTQVPEGYLSKVLQELVRAELVVSRRGKGGGFTLRRPAGDISILQVLDAVDPLQRIHTCPLGLPAHRERLCALHRRLDDAMAAVEADFAAATVAELVDQAAPEAVARPGLERLPIGLGVPPSAGFDQPLQLLSDCHRRIERFLDSLGRLVELCPGAPLSGLQREGLDTALRYFAGMAPKHTEDEERSLFPRLGAGDPALLARLQGLEADHDRAAAAHAELHTLGRRWLADDGLDPRTFRRFANLLAGLRDTYRRHIRIEDEEVFPAAGRLLPAAALAAVGREMAERRGSLTCSQRKAMQAAAG